CDAVQHLRPIYYTEVDDCPCRENGWCIASTANAHLACPCGSYWWVERIQTRMSFREFGRQYLGRCRCRGIVGQVRLWDHTIRVNSCSVDRISRENMVIF